MTSLREKILAAHDVPEEVVAVPEWDVTLTVRGLTVREQERFYRSLQAKQPKGRKGKADSDIETDGFAAKLLVLTVYDEAGKDRVFEEGDAAALLEKSSRPVQRLFAAAQRLNGLGDEAKADIEGN